MWKVSLVLVSFALSGSFITPSQAQYMYLDANGDGLNSTSDRLNHIGTTTLDLWLDTYHDRTGAVVACSDGVTQITLSSYEFILRSGGGTINWGSYNNLQTGMSVSFGLASSPTDYHNGFGGSTYLPPGLYKLGSLTVSVASGNPGIVFAPATLLGSAYATTFGSQCPGHDFDNTLKLGGDWSDTGGIVTDVPTFSAVVPALGAAYLWFGTGAAPQSVAVGDFNGDGRPDFATANQGGNNVSVFLAQGDGTFRSYLPKADYVTGAQPKEVAIGDFNGDGKRDLVTSNFSANTVSILAGNGDGTFGSKSDVSVGTNPWGVSVGEFNGDGKQDLVVANSGSNTISILLGNGNGTFGSPTSYSTGVQPRRVAVTDLDAVAADLIVANAGSGTVSTFFGVGNGTFGARTDYFTGSSPSDIAIRDLGVGPGTAFDLAVAKGADSISVFPGNGDGTFGTRIDWPAGPQAVALASADYNGDNRFDLIVANGTGSQVNLLAGSPDPTKY